MEDGVRTTQEQLSANPGMDGVRTTQEQLSADLLGEALDAPRLIKKRSNWLKSTASTLLIFAGRSTTFCKISLCYNAFFLRLTTLSAAKSRIIFTNDKSQFQPQKLT